MYTKGALLPHMISWPFRENLSGKTMKAYNGSKLQFRQKNYPIIMVADQKVTTKP